MFSKVATSALDMDVATNFEVVVLLLNFLLQKWAC